jgi:hypothetical protein
MYCERFQYQALTRHSGPNGRLYNTPDGQKLPSVTTILDRTKSQESRQALQQWRQRVGTVQAQAITTEAANRGTRMHTYLEHYIRTGELRERGSNPFSWSSHAMAMTMIDQGLKNVSELWGVEIPLWFPGIYAGTSDAAGVHLLQESILDYKQTNKPKKREWIQDYFLQLAAYAEAHNQVHGTKIKRGVVMMCVKPELDANNEIIKPPQYQEFVLEHAEFEACRQQWWRRVEQFYALNT